MKKVTSDGFWKIFVEEVERGRVLEMKLVYWENSNKGVGQDKTNSPYRMSFLPP